MTCNFKRPEYINEIDSLLKNIEEGVIYSNQQGKTDIDLECEDFYCGLLNIIFEYNLENCNVDKLNYPGIDLADKNKRIAFQITSNKSTKKISDGLVSFEKYKYYKIYDKLFFFIICRKKPKYRKDFKHDYHNFEFSVENNVFDNTYILNYLKKCDTQVIYDVLQYIKREVAMLPFHTSLKSINKPFYKSNYFYDRKLCSYEMYSNNSMLDQQVSIDIDDFIKNISQKTIILSDAGLGKTEFCKMVANKINEDDNKIAVYYKLNTYCGGEIETLKGVNYKDIDNSLFTYVLDGYDEIDDSFKATFISKLNIFLENNPNTKAILSCRTNFYGDYGKDKFNNYLVYRLLPLSNNELKCILENNNIDSSRFTKAIKKYNLNPISHNPFYLECLIKLYKNNTLTANKEIMSIMVENMFDVDISKYIKGDLQEDKLKILKILKYLSFSFALLEKTSITTEEYQLILINKEDRKLVSHTSLLSIENNHISFIHNNFYEYFVSELLKRLTDSQILDIVTINNKTVNDKWINILNYFLIDENKGALAKELLKKSPEIIFSVETLNYSIEDFTNVFINTIDSYDSKGIVIPYGFYTKSLDFCHKLSSGRIIDYLLNKIDEKALPPVITNSLDLLEICFTYNEKESNVKTTLLDIIKDSNYSGYHKAKAFKILSDKKMIDDKEFLALVEFNEKIEGPYLRAAYYHYLSTNLNDENIKILFSGKTKARILSTVNYETDNNGYTITSEHNELDKLFGLVNNKKCISILIEYLNELDDELSNKILSQNRFESLCYSIEWINYTKNELVSILLNLFGIISKHFHSDNINSLSSLLEKRHIKLDFFKNALKKYKNNWELFVFMNEQCSEYFLKLYINNKISEEITRVFLTYSNIKDDNYFTIKSLYYKKHNIYDESSIKPSKSSNDYDQEFFDSIFDEQTFINNVNNYLNLLGVNSKKISKEIIKEKERDNFDLYAENTHISSFLKDFHKNSSYSINDIKNINWDYFIICNSYKFINDSNPICVTDKQRDKIISICNKYVKKISFRDAIKYKKRSCSCDVLAIYLCYFGVKYDINYDEKIMLDMLSFNWDFNDNEDKLFNYLKSKINPSLFEKRVIDNIKNKYMGYHILQSHVNYCMDNDILYLSNYLIKYLLNECVFTEEKSLIIDYIEKANGMDFLFNLLDKLDFNTKICVLRKANFNISDKWYLYIKRKYSYSKKNDEKLEYLKLLINSCDIWSIKTYNKLLTKNNKYVDNESYYSFSKIIENIDNIGCLGVILEMYLTTLNKNFRDSDFRSLNSACSNSLYKMAMSDITNNSYKTVIDTLNKAIINNKDLEKIYYINYIIERINDAYIEKSKEHYTIDEVIKKYKDLFGDTFI